MMSFIVGGRGLVREVFMGDDYRWNLDIVEQYPYAYPNSSAGMFTIEERSYRTSSHPSSFGERVNFNQRYTGFFVPHGLPVPDHQSSSTRELSLQMQFSMVLLLENAKPPCSTISRPLI